MAGNSIHSLIYAEETAGKLKETDEVTYLSISVATDSFFPVQ